MESLKLEPEYRALKARWLAGGRDRELALRLLFFAWMHWADPSFVTGLKNDDPDAEDLWHAAFVALGGETSEDAEFLFAAGIMAEIFPFVLGDEKEWEARGSRMIDRAMVMQPAQFTISTFENRGEYGRYFAHHLRGRLGATE